MDFNEQVWIILTLMPQKKLGIKVFNTPDAPTLAVAELTVGLILNLLRKANQRDMATQWHRHSFPIKNNAEDYGRKPVGESVSAEG